MIEIDGTPVGQDQKSYVIAEVGINARDDLELAKRFIDIAAESGADAVKFQTHIADAEMAESEMREIGAGAVYDTVSKCEWSLEDHQALQAHAERNNVTFLSTPFSVEGIELLDDLDVPCIKIGSGELQNRELLERAGQTGKPLLVSTGMHTWSEIEQACSFIETVADDFALFYCVSEYPTSKSDFDFKTIEALQQAFDVPVGFSDHSIGSEAAKVAIGNGATLIEKHFTIDRRLPGPDQEVSIEPETLSEICSFAELFYKTSSEKEGVKGEESEIKQWAQHSLVAKQTIEEGEKFTKDNLTTKRPGTGVPASEYLDHLGKKAASKIRADTILTRSDIR